MADLKINQIGLATMVVTLLGIDNDGSLKRISIADVLAAFGVRNYGVISKQDLDDCMTGWGYCSNSGVVSGCFLSVSNSECRLQIHADLNGSNLFFRASDFNGDWSSWKKVTFTLV